MRNLGVISVVYGLPFGNGKPFASGLGGFGNGAVSGWSVNSLVALQAGFPVYAATQLQPVEQWRHAQSGAAFRQSELHRECHHRKTRASGSIPTHFCSRRRTAGSSATCGEIRWSARGSPRGISRRERHLAARAVEPAVPGRDLQPAEPGELQHSESHRVHAHRSFGHGGSHLQHVDHRSPGSIRSEGALVAIKGGCGARSFQRRVPVRFCGAPRRRR